VSGTFHSRLGRRLWTSVRQERPSSELRARVLAAGRAERARMAFAPQLVTPELERTQLERTREKRPRRLPVRWALGALAAAALALLWTRLEPRAVLISAERSSPVLGSPASGVAAPASPATPGPTRSGPAARDARENADETSPAATPRSAAPEAQTPPETPAPTRTVATPHARPRDVPEADTAAASPAPIDTEAPTATLPTGTEARTDTPPARVAGNLAEQLEQIKRVRAALRAGKPELALSLLDAPGAETDTLAEEASLLRIESLALAGRHEESARAARAFAERHPSSPLIDRAMSFAGER
jgi:hypothetical protein